MKEVWKIFGLNPNYEISNTGKVRNSHTLKELAQRDNGHGYKTVHLYNNSRRKVQYIHRLVAQTFLENNNNKLEVNHLDGNKSNNNVNNLEWCTRSENHKHAYKMGLKVTTDKMRKNSRKQLDKINSDPVLRAKALKKAAVTNSLKSQTEYMMNSSNQFKPIKCVELNRIFLNARRVEVKIGIKRNTMQCSIARNNKTCGGYHWVVIEKHRFNNYGKAI